jgi:hypothetical protein
VKVGQRKEEDGMSRRKRLDVACLAVSLACAGPSWAHDPWETGLGDDSSSSSNLLRHGVVQQGHDLEGAPPTPDRDRMMFVARARHSYEARVSGLYWDDGCAGTPCPVFDRVDLAGTVLTPGVASNDDIDLGSHTRGRTVRWISEGGREYLRALGDQLIALPPDPYDVVYYDTTLFVPRWNNTGSQQTVLILQNTTSSTTRGFVYFYDAAGALLTNVEINVPEHAVRILPTATIPELAGRSGSAQIAQLGGYEALAGKAVALEPATGFTFDTAITPLPR